MDVNVAVLVHDSIDGGWIKKLVHSLLLNVNVNVNVCCSPECEDSPRKLRVGRYYFPSFQTRTPTV